MLGTGIQRCQVTVTYGSMLGVTAAFLGALSAQDLDQAVVSQPWLLATLPSLAASPRPGPSTAASCSDLGFLNVLRGRMTHCSAIQDVVTTLGPQRLQLNSAFRLLAVPLFCPNVYYLSPRSTMPHTWGARHLRTGTRVCKSFSHWPWYRGCQAPAAGMGIAAHP